MRCRKRKICRYYRGDHCNLDMHCRGMKGQKHRDFEHIKTDLFYDLENKFKRDEPTFSDRIWHYIDRMLTKLHLNPYP